MRDVKETMGQNLCREDSESASHCKSLLDDIDNDVCKEPTRQRICWHFPGLALLKIHGGAFEIVAFSLPHFLYNLSFINPQNAVSLLIDCIMQSSCF